MTSIVLPRSAYGRSDETMAIVGILSPTNPLSPEQWAGSFVNAKLRQLGWVSGKNLIFELAYAEGDEARLPELAVDLVRKRVAVIWAQGPEAAVAARRATQTIPIVFWGVRSPVELGLVNSISRPGGNVTGVAYGTGIELASKQLELLREIAPRARRLAWLSITAPRTVEGNEYVGGYAYVEFAARNLGFVMRRHFVSRKDDFEAAFAAILESRAESLGLHGGNFWRERFVIAEFAKRHRLPTTFPERSYAEAGGLMAYGLQHRETIVQSFLYVDRILRGAKPVDLPVELPSKYELTINLKTAKLLNLSVPPSLLLRADYVLE